MIKYLLTFSLILSSCNLINLKESYNYDDIKSYYNYYGIDTNYVFILDTNYIDYVFYACNKDTSLAHDFLQPAQIHYIENDSLLSLSVNCYAAPWFDPFLNMRINWNSDSTFNEFPPKNNIYDVYSNNIKLDSMLKYSEKLTSKEIELQNDFKIVVFTSIFLETTMYDQLDALTQNLKMKDRDVDIIFFLTDKIMDMNITKE